MEVSKPVPVGVLQGLIGCSEAAQGGAADDASDAANAQDAAGGSAVQVPTCHGDFDCDDKNPCTSDRCSAAFDCVRDFTFKPCDDSKARTESDVCDHGVCKGTSLACVDGNPCTDDNCGAGGCIHLANAATCDDGDGCTSSDACTANRACVGLPSCP